MAGYGDMTGLMKKATAPNAAPGDYVGEDDLLYCGKCNTPKQCWVDFPPGLFGDGGRQKVNCTCKCRKDALEMEKRRMEFQERMHLISRLKSAFPMDDKYRDASFKSYYVRDANKRAFKIGCRYVQIFDEMLAKNQGILFYGPIGTGKTYTSACIANALMNRGVPVVMTSFVKILQTVQYQNEMEQIAIFNKADLLILDDLGAERDSDYALEKVYNVIDSRSRKKKPMILTTNLSLQEMMETRDKSYKRIYDRILETCHPVEVAGESFRLAAAEKRFDEMQKIMEG